MSLFVIIVVMADNLKEKHLVSDHMYKHNLRASPALWKVGGGVYGALAICTVFIGIACVTTGLNFSIRAAGGREKNNDMDFRASGNLRRLQWR